jgi:hypothetical protein
VLISLECAAGIGRLRLRVQLLIDRLAAEDRGGFGVVVE